MTKAIISAALLLSALPAFAQTRHLTPPDVLAKAKTIQFTATVYRNQKLDEVYTASLCQPNKFFINGVDTPTNKTDYTSVSDGQTQTVFTENQPSTNSSYIRVNPPSQIADVSIRDFSMSMFLKPSIFAKYIHVPNDPLGTYRKSTAYFNDDTRTQVLRVDPKSGLPISLVFFSKSRGSLEQPTTRIIFGGWRLDAPVDGSTFVYTPPANAELSTEPQLLANGTLAPDFTVQNKDGKPVKLSDYRGKTVILDFWSTWCGPCQMSLPHTTQIAKKYASKNVVVLAVNVWDTKPAFDDWLPKHPEYAALYFLVDPQKYTVTAHYHVSGIPTQYVINPLGKIVISSVGYNPDTTNLEDALGSATVTTAANHE